MTNWWKLARSFAVLAVACFVAGLMRDPMRGHLVPRNTFINLLQAAVVLASGAALAAAFCDMRKPRPDENGTFIAGWIGLLYVPVIHAWASHYSVAAWGCGTGRAYSTRQAGTIATMCMGFALCLAVAALIRDSDRRRAARCLALVLALSASQTLFPTVLDRDRTKPANHRACFANQRTIAGALEMWELDKRPKITALSPAAWESLKSGGYMQSTPTDPDVLPPTSATYSLTSTSPLGVVCSRHGTVQ